MNIFPNKIYQCILVRHYTTSEVSISILLDSFLNKSIYQSRTAQKVITRKSFLFFCGKLTWIFQKTLTILNISIHILSCHARHNLVTFYFEAVSIDEAFQYKSLQVFSFQFKHKDLFMNIEYVIEMEPQTELVYTHQFGGNPYSTEMIYNHLLLIHVEWYLIVTCT